MTTAQKNRIVTLRIAGFGYDAIAREIGLAKSTVSSFCQKNGLARDQKNTGITGKKSLPFSPVRVNTEHAEKPVRQSVPGFRVTTFFADEPNEAAVAEALRILTNV